MLIAFSAKILCHVHNFILNLTLILGTFANSSTEWNEAKEIWKYRVEIKFHPSASNIFFKDFVNTNHLSIYINW